VSKRDSSAFQSFRHLLTRPSAWAAIGVAIAALVGYWNTRLSDTGGRILTALVLLTIGLVVLAQDPMTAPKRLRLSGVLRLPYRILVSALCVLSAVVLVAVTLPVMAHGRLPAFDVRDISSDSGQFVVPAPPNAVPDPCDGEWWESVKTLNPISAVSFWHTTLTGRQEVLVGLPRVVIDQSQPAVRGTFVSFANNCGEAGADEGLQLQIDLDSGGIKYFSGTQLQKSPRTISLRPGEDFGLDIEGLTKNHVFWHVELPVYSKPNQYRLGELRVPNAGSIETTGPGLSVPLQCP